MERGANKLLREVLLDMHEQTFLSLFNGLAVARIVKKFKSDGQIDLLFAVIWAFIICYILTLRELRWLIWRSAL